ncbi:IS66 family transposase [Pandoraea apista]|uniref:IS66 family transposase n=1 Tax=Pandoraea apista TaxID=93218 RepID=UPI001639A59D
MRQRDGQVAALKERLSTREQEIAHLKLLIDKLKRMQFGRKSEQLARQIEQLELRLEDLQADEGAAEAATPIQSQPKSVLSARRYPSTLSAKSAFICPKSTIARPVAVDSSHWAKTSPNRWNTCERTSV